VATMVAWNLTVNETRAENASGSSGVAKISIWQENFPADADSTDVDPDNHKKEMIVPSENKIAYITGVPEVPKLKAKLIGADPGSTVKWRMVLVTERPNLRGQLDDQSYPASGTTEVPESGMWDICSEMQSIAGKKYNGGDITVHYQYVKNGVSINGTSNFTIRGKNPKDADAKAYIPTAIPTSGHACPWAWGIAQHESRENQRVYNQFNANALAERPNWGSPDGWGIGQIDRTGDMPPGTITTAEVFNWKTNVDGMMQKLRTKEIENAQTILNGIKRKYPNDDDAKSPPDFTNGGKTLSAYDWLIIVGYNGMDGCPWQPVVNSNNQAVSIRSCVLFDPNANPKWSFHDNVNDYAAKVGMELDGKTYTE
jgi:hypothetical protein